ncbi:hypothetical protein DsansV1_C04g0049261 [Dioscorea sansibarensis]
MMRNEEEEGEEEHLDPGNRVGETAQIRHLGIESGLHKRSSSEQPRERLPIKFRGRLFISTSTPTINTPIITINVHLHFISLQSAINGFPLLLTFGEE